MNQPSEKRLRMNKEEAEAIVSLANTVHERTRKKVKNPPLSLTYECYRKRVKQWIKKGLLKRGTILRASYCNINEDFIKKNYRSVSKEKQIVLVQEAKNHWAINWIHLADSMWAISSVKASDDVERVYGHFLNCQTSVLSNTSIYSEYYSMVGSMMIPVDWIVWGEII